MAYAESPPLGRCSANVDVDWAERGKILGKYWENENVLREGLGASNPFS
jgi:hypothetical protein